MKGPAPGNCGFKALEWTRFRALGQVRLLLKNDCSMESTSETDILFFCADCSASLVVDSAAAGVTLDCQKCGKPTTVPSSSVEAAGEEAAKISDLQRQLKENESQRTEITGYINQHSIQLHRWQLRLQTLNERQKKLQTELAETSGRQPASPL